MVAAGGHACAVQRVSRDDARPGWPLGHVLVARPGTARVQQACGSGGRNCFRHHGEYHSQETHCELGCRRGQDAICDCASMGTFASNEVLLGHAEVPLQEAHLVPQQVFSDVWVTGVVSDAGEEQHLMRAGCG